MLDRSRKQRKYMRKSTGTMCRSSLRRSLASSCRSISALFVSWAESVKLSVPETTLSSSISIDSSRKQLNTLALRCAGTQPGRARWTLLNPLVQDESLGEQNAVTRSNFRCDCLSHARGLAFRGTTLGTNKSHEQHTHHNHAIAYSATA